jgi:hypothetical protein
MSPKTSAILCFLLALPFAALFPLIFFGIEPSLGLLDPLLKAIPSRAGSLIVFALLLLMLAGFVISLLPAVQGVREGRGPLTHMVHLALASLILLFLFGFAGGVIVDQYPCWAGVPNCDFLTN